MTHEVQKRLVKIVSIAIVMVVLTAAASYLAFSGKDYSDLQKAADFPGSGWPDPAEAGSFNRLSEATLEQYQAFDYDALGDHGRTWEEFDMRRAYPGAPPVIPHPVSLSDDPAPGEPCLSCHELGGFAPKFQAYTPVVPHPEKTNCLQCHTSPETEELFVPSEFIAAVRPALGQAAMPGAPPPMPHALEMRENCLSCHSGPAAIPEIRTTHPERSNCLQCHVPTNATDVFVRREE